MTTWRSGRGSGLGRLHRRAHPLCLVSSKKSAATEMLRAKFGIGGAGRENHGLLRQIADVRSTLVFRAPI